MLNHLKKILIGGLSIFMVGALSWYFKVSPWQAYLENKLNKPPRPFIVKALADTPSPENGAIALDLGCGVGNETLLLLRKGYKVIAVDHQQIAFNLMHKNTSFSSYNDRLIPLLSSFEKLNTHPLPLVDLVLASYSLPFCAPSSFHDFWQYITTHLKPGGYFIGNTFDPGFTAFPEKDRPYMTFHTKAQTLTLFKDFEIISLKEIQHPGLQPGTFDHFYEIVAKKKERGR